MNAHCFYRGVAIYKPARCGGKWMAMIDFGDGVSTAYWFRTLRDVKCAIDEQQKKQKADIK